MKLIACGEREKATLYRDITQAEGEHQLVEAKAEAQISPTPIRVPQDDVHFLAELKRQVFTDILARLRLLLLARTVFALVVRTILDAPGA